MKINTIKKLLSYFVFIIFIASGFAFTNSSVSPSNFETDTSTMFTDYFFPDPKKRDGKKQFVKKLCLESEKVVEDRIKEIIKSFKKDKGYKKNKIGDNPDVGWHRKTGELIFRNAKEHKKTYAPKLDKEAMEGKGVKISTFGDCE